MGGKPTLNGVRLTPAPKVSPRLLADNAKALVPPVRTPPIRIIKLIVRAPGPIYTNPKHRPAPPIFNKSIMSALTSYTRLENDDISAIALEDAACERAVLACSLIVCTLCANRVTCSCLLKTPVAPSKPGRRIHGQLGQTHGIACSTLSADVIANVKRAGRELQLPSRPRFALIGTRKML